MGGGSSKNLTLNFLYRLFINFVFFPSNFEIFWTLPALLQRWCSTCLVCVHTLTPWENRVRNIFKSSEKNTIFIEHPVSLLFNFSSFWHYGIKFRIFEYRTIYISVNRSMFIMTSIPLELLFFYLSVSNDLARHKGITSLCLVSHMFESKSSLMSSVLKARYNLSTLSASPSVCFITLWRIAYGSSEHVFSMTKQVSYNWGGRGWLGVGDRGLGWGG